MAHPKPSSRLLCQLKKGTRSAPLLDWGAIGGVGWGVKGGVEDLKSQHVSDLSSRLRQSRFGQSVALHCLGHSNQTDTIRRPTNRSDM